jgi:hypothetical protein
LIYFNLGTVDVDKERREHPRGFVERALYIEVVEPGSRAGAEHRIVRCETVDVSVAGLRVWVPEEIPNGSVLNIAAQVDDWKDEVQLVGKVRWVENAENDYGYWVGFELQDSSTEDMLKWHTVVKRLQEEVD